MEYVHLKVTSSERTSKLGHSMCIPDVWQEDDRGDIWTFYGDGISLEIHTFLLEGSPSLSDFLEATLNNVASDVGGIIAPDVVSDLLQSSGISIKSSVLPIPLADGNCTLVYGTVSDSLMLVIILQAATETLILNETFFDGVVATLRPRA
jgi:hypothetical protein